jgi:hypothetical protein
MKNQPGGNPPGFFVKEPGKIDSNSPKTVKRMKIDTASPGIKNWVGKQMICINYNCQQHNQTSHFPVLPEKYPCNSKWKYQVQGIMNNRLPIYRK